MDYFCQAPLVNFCETIVILLPIRSINFHYSAFQAVDTETVPSLVDTGSPAVTPIRASATAGFPPQSPSGGWSATPPETLAGSAPPLACWSSFSRFPGVSRGGALARSGESAAGQTPSPLTPARPTSTGRGGPRFGRPA